MSQTGAQPVGSTRVSVLAGLLCLFLIGTVWLAPPSSAALDLVAVVRVQNGAVGDTIEAAFALGNNSSLPESGVVVRFGAIDFYPSCTATGPDCANGTVEPDVYDLRGPFTSVAVTPNATCSGDWSATEASPGRWRFTPPLGEDALALPAGDVCIVRFHALVTHVPATDVDETRPGTQTRNVVSATPNALVGGTFPRETADSTSTVTSPPTSTTTTMATTTTVAPATTTTTSAPVTTTTTTTAPTTTTTTTTTAPTTTTTTTAPTTTTTAPTTTTTLHTDGTTTTTTPATSTTTTPPTSTSITVVSPTTTTTTTPIAPTITTTTALTITTSTSVAVATSTTTTSAATTAPATSTTTTTAPPGGIPLVSPAQGLPGQAIVLSGTGFRPNERLTATFNSTPVVLAVFNADATGSYAITTQVPAGAAPGGHTIVVAGESGRTTSTPFTVPGPTAVSTPLSRTGFSVRDPIILAGLLLMLGASALLWARRRPG